MCATGQRTGGRTEARVENGLYKKMYHEQSGESSLLPDHLPKMRVQNRRFAK